MRVRSGMKLAAAVGAAAMMLGAAGQASAESTLSGAGLSMASAGMEMMAGPRYMLHLHHLHTGESLDIVYRVGNTYLPEALDQLNFFLRDHRTQAASDYDPKEFDLLHSILSTLHKPNAVIDIVCGYRTPESNQYLRTRSEVTGVAEHSQHMLAKAIDIRIPGVRTLTLRNAALALAAGGVGYYPTSQFVHVDVGPVREWQFGGMRARMHRVSGHVRGHLRRRRG